MNIGPIPMSLQELFLENHRLMLSAREEESGESSARVAQHLSKFWFGTSKWGPFTESHVTPISGCFMVLIYSYNYIVNLQIICISTMDGDVLLDCESGRYTQDIVEWLIMGLFALPMGWEWLELQSPNSPTLWWTNIAMENHHF